MSDLYEELTEKQDEVDRLRDQRDKLLEACEAAAEWAAGYPLQGSCSDADARSSATVFKLAVVVGSLLNVGDQLVEAVRHLLCCEHCKDSGSQLYWAKEIGKLSAKWEDVRR